MAKRGASAARTKHLAVTTVPDIESSPAELLHHHEYKYLLVNVLARRARELNMGAAPLTKVPETSTWTEIPIAEIEADKLRLLRKRKQRVLVNLVESE